MKLDKTDEKIIEELLADSRQTDTNIAKKIRRSKQVVNYRIKHLAETGVIVTFRTEINIAKLGLNSFADIFFSLKSADQKRQEEIINFLCNHPKVPYVSKISGRFDFAIVLATKNNFEMYNVIREIVGKYPENLSNYEISFRYNYIINTASIKEVHGENEIYVLDNLERNILKLMTKNSRMSSVDMAKVIGIPLTTLISRIKKLENNKVIGGYGIHTDLKKRGLRLYRILVSIRNMTKKEELTLLELKEDKNVSGIVLCFGKWDVEFFLHVRDSEDAQNFAMKLRNLLPPISDVEIVETLKEHKEDYSIFLNLA